MKKADELSDDALARYSRQLLLPNFGVAGQLALQNATALIIGLGGLGSSASLYLAASGLGRLILVDHDVVEHSNLQRQIVHRENTVGEAKVHSAAQSLAALNADVECVALPVRADENTIETIFSEHDVTVVLDCSDNLSTRFAVNKHCKARQVPLVSGAAIRMEGQLAVFDFRKDNSPCYQCFYQQSNERELNCSEAGVLAPLVGVVGSLQALETIKLLCDMERDQPRSNESYVQYFDGIRQEWQRFSFRQDAQCPVCAAEPRKQGN